MAENKAILAIIGVVVVGVVGYGLYTYTQSEQEDTTEQSTSQAQNTTTKPAESSKNQTVQGALVDGFPGDKVPLYLGDIVESKRSTDSMDRAEYNVRIQTNDDMKKVVDRTETNYMNEGWNITSRPSNNMFIAHSEEFITTVNFSESDGGVLINYGITTK